MVAVVQLVRTSGCGSEGRGFEPHRSPKNSFVAQLVEHFLGREEVIGSNPIVGSIARVAERQTRLI